VRALQKKITKKIKYLKELIIGMLSEYSLPYNQETNPHPFYSFRGLKNQMRIRIACGLDSRS